MSERYNFCTKCDWKNECLSFFQGGRPPCGMVAEENFDSLLTQSSSIICNHPIEFRYAHPGIIICRKCGERVE